MTLLTGLAFLSPEVGHSLAHHHAAEHSAKDHAAGHGVIPQEHGHGEHPHVAVLASPPAKPLFQYTALIVRVAVLVLHETVTESSLTPVESAGLSPGNLFHGPPPPSRAPPQV